MFEDQIKHQLDENTLYLLSAPVMLSRKRSSGRDYICLVRLNKYDPRVLAKWEKVCIIEQWLSILGPGHDWVSSEYSHKWTLEKTIKESRSYWWEWRSTNKETFTYIEPSGSGRNDEAAKLYQEYSGKQPNWRKVQGEEKKRVLKREGILQRAYKNLVWIKLSEDMDERFK